MVDILKDKILRLLYDYSSQFNNVEHGMIDKTVHNFMSSYKIEESLKRMMITPEETAKALFTEIHIKAIDDNTGRDLIKGRSKNIEDFKRKVSDIFEMMRV